MPGLTTHTGTLAVIQADHVDTDRIIPARYLSRVTKTGYGELLFSDVRGTDFALDQPAAKGASVLVVGTNFGCGSSREHAVWAIQQAGFVAVIAHALPDSPGYSDIFRQNAANCGLLLVELPTADHETLVNAGSGTEVTIDVPSETIAVGHKTINFHLAPATKDQVLRGLDLIGSTLEFADEIAAFESQHADFSPSR